MKANLVLIGYRGTGKSTIAEILSRKLGRPRCSTDEEIVRRAGPIPVIVAREGWDGFRALEEKVVAEVASGSGRIIDCGGGVVLRPANVEALRRSGRIFWLTAPIPVLAGRISGDASRPSLTGKTITEEIAEVLAARTPLYEAAADETFSTEKDSPEFVAARIAESFLKAEP